MLVQGILLALVARARPGGAGQVVEANMVDGVSYLATFSRYALKTPVGDRPRGENLLDTGCPYYDTYETRDPGRYVAVGALEPQFFAQLLTGLGLQGQGWEQRRYDRANWDEFRAILERKFREKTRAEWEAVFDGTDACVTPVLEYPEMEADKARTEGDQRPAVTLRGTPCLAIRKGADGADPSHGQGAGVDGEGYDGSTLALGQGGVQTLESWLGWREGREFVVHNGAVALKDKAKL